jgi:hypothetical protein
MTIPESELIEARKVAQAAEPGPWHEEMLFRILMKADEHHDPAAHRTEAKHIATFHPAFALRLLDEVEALRKLEPLLREADELLYGARKLLNCGFCSEQCKQSGAAVSGL